MGRKELRGNGVLFGERGEGTGGGNVRKIGRCHCDAMKPDLCALRPFQCVLKV